MAQGKLKVKTKVPQNVKTKKQKGSAITKRASKFMIFENFKMYQNNICY